MIVIDDQDDVNILIHHSCEHEQAIKEVYMEGIMQPCAIPRLHLHRPHPRHRHRHRHLLRYQILAHQEL